jgi:2-hydroxychromene-2-carboxylate isomerase
VNDPALKSAQEGAVDAAAIGKRFAASQGEPDDRHRDPRSAAGERRFTSPSMRVPSERSASSAIRAFAAFCPAGRHGVSGQIFSFRKAARFSNLPFRRVAMSLTIEFFFDLGNPDTYLCLRSLPAIEGRIGGVFALEPVFLEGMINGTTNSWRIDALASMSGKFAYDRLETARFARHHGLDEFQHNPFFPINTSLIMRGAYAARKLGIFDPYIDTVATAMWERQLDMGNLTVFATALHEAGLPAADIYRESQHEEVKHELAAATHLLVDRGGSSTPTFFVGDEMFAGKDRLPDVEGTFLKQAA